MVVGVVYPTVTGTISHSGLCSDLLTRGLGLRCDAQVVFQKRPLLALLEDGDGYAADDQEYENKNNPIHVGSLRQPHVSFKDYG